MPPPVTKEKEDPEVILRRKFKAKCQFRALVRSVIENLYWLVEDEEVYEGDNVKKRVEQAMRAKSKKKTLLSLTDKALLNKPVAERTEVEKKYIYRKIGGLKCFKRYPNRVKRKLAAATYFRYYGPNRVIVRQNQEAHALYFIVTGEVVVSVLVYDELLKKNVSVNVFVMHAGDMFGEVSLLHNIKRTATCTTSGHCEFLALMTEDFKDVLQKSLQKQWDEVTLAMTSFTYFDGLDEVARREGCIVAKMKSYEPDETILGDGVGLQNFVYFVLCGRCQMIESLDISCKVINGKKFYKLHDTYVEQKEELDFEKKYFKDLKPSDKLSSSRSKDESIKFKEEGQSGDELKAASVSKQPSGSTFQLGNKESVNQTKKESKTTLTSKKRISYSLSKIEHEYSSEPIILSKLLLAAKEEPTLRESFKMSLPLSVSNKNIHTYFMQVCIFNPASTFGFGENMRDRRIVALDRVDCMMLPLVWLLQKNTANIWSRIQHYLEKKIPTKKQLFQEFVQQRRWLDFRESLVSDIVSRSKTVNHTTVHDVPYSIRMQEMLDI